MSLMKTTAVAALVAAGALGAGMGAANAHGKKHHHFYGPGFGANTIVIGMPGYGYSCKRWLRKYKWTGNPYFLNRYYDCISY